MSKGKYKPVTIGFEQLADITVRPVKAEGGGTEVKLSFIARTLPADIARLLNLIEQGATIACVLASNDAKQDLRVDVIQLRLPEPEPKASARTDPPIDDKELAEQERRETWEKLARGEGEVDKGDSPIDPPPGNGADEAAANPILAANKKATSKAK